VLTPRLQRILAGIVAVAGCVVIALGGWTIARERALTARGVVIDAVVTAVEHREADSSTGHQVQYRFEIGGRAYRHVGIFGTSVATDISADALAEAEASGRVAVVYVPDDPSVNALAPRGEATGPRGVIAVAIGAAMLLGALGIGAASEHVARLNDLHGAPHAPRGPLLRPDRGDPVCSRHAVAVYELEAITLGDELIERGLVLCRRQSMARLPRRGAGDLTKDRGVEVL
jgi:hypothetical protein